METMETQKIAIYTPGYLLTRGGRKKKKRQRERERTLG
jgi:hypothetical protein